MREIRVPFQNPGLSLYKVYSSDPNADGHVFDYGVESTDGKESFEITFQEGNLLEDGVNGLVAPILLQILIDHLQNYQAGWLSNRETAIALTKLEEAVLWLAKRSDDRWARNVLGSQEK